MNISYITCKLGRETDKVISINTGILISLTDS